MFREIEIKDNTQVEKINQLACQTPYEVWLSTDTLMLDARSLLGLFALVGQKAHVIAEDDVNPRVFDKLVSKMAVPDLRCRRSGKFPGSGGGLRLVF